MKRLSLIPLIGLLGGLGFGVACSSGGDDEAGVADPVAFCASVCERRHSCKNSDDTQTCAAACRNEAVVRFPTWRSEAISMVAACVDKKDCDAILGDIGGVVGSCTEVAIESLAPLGSAQAFCEDFSGIATTCGKVVDRAQCLRLTRLNNDKVLNQARQCTTKPCSDVVPCIEATLALDLGTSESGGGSGSGGGGTGSGGTGSGGTGSGGTGSGGTGSGTPGSTSNAMCNGNTATSAVSQCLFSKCCPQWSACENNPSCNQLFVCLANCPSGDNVCQDGCGAMYGAGIGALNTLFDCWDANACSGSGGSGTGGGQSG